MGNKYNAVVVVGPEGSGTTALANLTSRLTGWRRTDPSAVSIQRFQMHSHQAVHHISFPSHRPEVWWSPSEAWPDTTPVIGIVRRALDSTYSAWRRFHEYPLGQAKTVEDYWEYHIKARQMTYKYSKVVMVYERLCMAPQVNINRLALFLGVDSVPYADLGMEFESQNGKFYADKAFMRGVYAIPGFTGVV